MTNKGVVADWTQSYAYDRYGNRQTVTPSGVTANNQAVPSDGLPNQSYDAPSNRINTSGYLYDLMGNLTRGQDASGNWQTYEYDQAGRTLRVRDASNNILETHFYAADRQRYGVENSTQRTYYAWGGASVLEEYTEPLAGNTPTYSKSYIYASSRLLSTYTNNGGTETLQLQHPDRLGTKLVTNPQSATQFEQATLPFGTALDAETTGTTNQRFTSYDRSNVASLDYAVNRSYSSGQGRFTQVDPIGMSATKQTNPQSLNLYAYVWNNPVDFTDPSGLDKEAPYTYRTVRIWVKHDSDSGSPFSWGGFDWLYDGPSGDPGETGGGGGGGDPHEQIHQQRKAKCPPKSQAYTFYANSQELETYEKAVALAEKNKREEGGWIYQDGKGNLKAVIRNRDAQSYPGDDTNHTVLSYPPNVKGARVVGTFHVHLGNSGGIDSYPSGYEYIENGILHQSADYATNGYQQVPGLILSRSPSGKVASVPYGPERGFFNVGVPKECK